MNIRRILLASLGGVLALGASAVLAQNVFRDLSSTVDGRSTWDADLINVEGEAQSGRGVYVAVLDTGLVPNWLDYFPAARVATSLGTGFDQPVAFKALADPCGFGIEVGKLTQSTWVGSRSSTHGTHVASTILGYFYQSNNDALAGFPLPPLVVRGIAPEVTVIPVRVLADYHVPALPRCPDPDVQGGFDANFGTSDMVAAGIRYVTRLKRAGYSPMVINMSLGGPALSANEKSAIDEAIAAGVIVVAAAGNEGEAGMGFPGAYAPVISAGSVGWIREWLFPGDGPRYRMWWLKYDNVPMLPGSGNVPEPTRASDVYVSDFSSRALPGQQLDVLAPGSWVRGPFPGTPGYTHLPWYSRGIGNLRSGIGTNFFFVGGTSMATPHVASVAALMLEKNPSLTQPTVERILKETALALPPNGSRHVFDFDHFADIGWDTQCGDMTCDAVGSGVVQADKALDATPAP